MKNSILIALVLLVGHWAFAGNTFYPVSTNARGGAMGGAEIAVPSAAVGIVSNPANFTTTHSHTLFTSLGINIPKNEADSPTAGEVSSETEVYPIGSFAYGYRMRDFPISLGFAVYPVVGAGARFEDYDLGGISGTLEVEFALIKAAPTIALHLSEHFTIGASFELAYSRLKLDNFSELDFIGGHTVDADTFAYGGKFGLYYEFLHTSIGLVYTLDMPLDYEGEYEEGDDEQDLEATGFDLPHVIELGIAHALLPNLLIAVDVSYFFWDDSFDEFAFERDNADNSVNPNPLISEADWSDQIAVGVGAEYRLGPHAFRLGYNYGNNPAASKSVTPTSAPTIQHHATIGYGYETEYFSFDLSYEYAFPNWRESKNPGFPETKINSSNHTAYFSVTYRFGGWGRNG